MPANGKLDSLEFTFSVYFTCNGNRLIKLLKVPNLFAWRFYGSNLTEHLLYNMSDFLSLVAKIEQSIEFRFFL